VNGSEAAKDGKELNQIEGLSVVGKQNSKAVTVSELR